ncbi:hypothetical protein BH09VER1_BH09VER1_08180 [soil metagenome]
MFANFLLAFPALVDNHIVVIFSRIRGFSTASLGFYKR